MESGPREFVQPQTNHSDTAQLNPQGSYDLFLEQFLEPVILPNTVQDAATPTWCTVRSVPTWDDF